MVAEETFFWQLHTEQDIKNISAYAMILFISTIFIYIRYVGKDESSLKKAYKLESIEHCRAVIRILI